MSYVQDTPDGATRALLVDRLRMAGDDSIDTDIANQ